VPWFGQSPRTEGEAALAARAWLRGELDAADLHGQGALAVRDVAVSATAVRPGLPEPVVLLGCCPAHRWPNGDG